MIRAIFRGFAVILLFTPALLAAQQKQSPTAYIYATYFTCHPATETRADEIIQRSYAPHYNAAVEAGNLSSWSWLAHYIGGQWRRVLVLTALDMNELLDASGALGEIIEEATPEAGRVFSEVCGEHVDYIWSTSPDVDGLRIGENRSGNASFSAYMVCDIGREERADEIMHETIGPVYKKYVESGQLGSWGWLQHNVGGEFRRLLTVTAEDHKSLMAARTAIVGELRSRKNERAYRQFNEICFRHDDYIWDIQVENP